MDFETVLRKHLKAAGLLQDISLRLNKEDRIILTVENPDFSKFEYVVVGDHPIPYVEKPPTQVASPSGFDAFKPMGS